MEDERNPYRMKEALTVDEIIAFLNEIVRIDRSAISALIDYHVPCNQCLADHPTVQVQKKTSPKVGFLGILNGAFGTDDEKWGPVAVELDDAGRVLQFFKTSSLQRKWGQCLS